MQRLPRWNGKLKVGRDTGGEPHIQITALSCTRVEAMICVIKRLYAEETFMRLHGKTIADGNHWSMKPLQL